MKIPIETGRWYNINKENRKCTKCSDNLIGDEFHYLFVCTNPDVVNLRTRYIPKYYLRNVSIEKMAGMLSICHTELFKNLSFFLKGLNTLFS